ncbi:MFS transporter [Chloroflexota bacterium]
MNELVHQQGKILVVASVITFLGFLDTHLLIPIMAIYASELGASVGLIGLIIGLYSLTNTPANVIFGRLIDRVGYKFPLIVGLIGDAVSMSLYSVSRLPVHLALVRVLHGSTGGMVGPATMSLMAEHSAEPQRGRAMAYYGTSLAAATLAGYGLSGFLTSRLGYRAVFLLGAILLVLGASLSFLLPKDNGQHSDLVITSFGESWARMRSLLARKGPVIAYISIFAQYFTFGGVVTLLPLHIRNMGMEAFHVGMLMAAFAIVFIILQYPIGALSDRVGRLRPTVAGISLSMVALITIPSVHTFPLLLVAMALYGAAYGVLFPSISALVIGGTAAEERGMATGIFHALLTAGVAIGAPVMGGIGQIAGVGIGLLLNSVVIILALFAILALARGTKPV